MTKVEELQQTYSAKARETRREMNALAERLEAETKSARAAIKNANHDGMVEGAVAATAAAVGVIVVDSIMKRLAGKWPWLEKYRKWLDLAIGIVLVGISRLKKSWFGLFIAGLVWLAIQIFGRLANMAGLASGFSVEGVGAGAASSPEGVEGLDEVDLALVGACLAGVDDEGEAYLLAEAAETGIIPAAAAVAIPALLQVANQYGPEAVRAVQRMVEAAKKGRKTPHAKNKILEARAVRQAQKSSQEKTVENALKQHGALLPQPQTVTTPALSSGEHTELLKNLQASFEQALRQGREQMEARLSKMEAQQAQAQQAQAQQVQAQQAQAQQVQAQQVQAQSVEGGDVAGPLSNIAKRTATRRNNAANAAANAAASEAEAAVPADVSAQFNATATASQATM